MEKVRTGKILLITVIIMALTIDIIAIAQDASLRYSLGNSGEALYSIVRGGVRFIIMCILFVFMYRGSNKARIITIVLLGLGIAVGIYYLIMAFEVLLFVMVVIYILALIALASGPVKAYQNHVRPAESGDRPDSDEIFEAEPLRGKKKRVAPVAIAAFLIAAASMFLIMANLPLDSGGAGEKRIISSQSGLALQIPDSWGEYELTPDATIQICDRQLTKSMIVFEEPDADFTDDFTLEGYTYLILELMLENDENAEFSEISDITIGGNIMAKQFELSCVIDNIKLRYLVTCTKVDDTFYQFCAWTVQSQFNNAKPVFEKILNSASFELPAKRV